MLFIVCYDIELYYNKTPSLLGTVSTSPTLTAVLFTPAYSIHTRYNARDG